MNGKVWKFYTGMRLAPIVDEEEPTNKVRRPKTSPQGDFCKV